MSNANFTVNLLHSFSGVDFYNIKDGPSNGLELLSEEEDLFINGDLMIGYTWSLYGR